MARKKKHEEHENHERWLVSYADFITLLFAFFVVMYSISSVNEGKYRVLSDSISSAFTGKVGLKPIKLGDPIKTPINGVVNSQQTNTSPSAAATEALNGQAKEAADAEDQQTSRELNAVADEISNELKPLIDKEMIMVNRDKNRIEVDINTSILFSSGSAELQDAAQPVLRTLSNILGDKNYQVQVEGFTDNVPINTEAFPSNWELSAARAASVVRVFAAEGVSPQRLMAIGYGEHRPITDNSTEENRSKNRRVRVVILPATQDVQATALRQTGGAVLTPTQTSPTTLPEVELDFPR